MVKYSILIILFFNINAVIAVEIKDYGVRGHTFSIIEESLLEVIMKKLQIVQQNGKLEKMQQQFKEKVIEKISRPVPVQGLVRASRNRSWKLDPTFTQKTDIRDQVGKIIIKAGTKINPLKTVNWGDPLIFIDGDDDEQVVFAKSQQGKIVLIKGNPVELGKKLHQPVFFDQAGILTKRFRITAIPATVEQDSNELKITEIKIN